MNYLHKFENGLIPDLNENKIDWVQARSTRIKLEPLPFEKAKNYFMWNVETVLTTVPECDIIIVNCSNGGFIELFIFDKIIYENHHSYPKNWDSHYFIELYEQLLKLSKNFNIFDYYCGEGKNKRGLYKVYNRTFQWWDIDIWSNNIDYYRYLCKVKN